MKSNAKQYVEKTGIIPNKPKANDNKLIIAESDGYSVNIVSSTKPNVIHLDGNILPGDYYELVKLVFEVSCEADNSKALTDQIDVLVPAKIDNSNGIYTEVDYISLRYGLLVHWVSGDNITKGNGHLLNSKDVRIGGIDSYCDEADVEKVADDIAKMGFEIVSFTDFHGLGIALHPSTAIDYWRGEGIFTPKRDLLRELIVALKKRGVYTAIFTHPLDGHDFPKEQQEILGWYDPTDNFKKWNDFVNDVYGDIASKYGKDIISMGFDSDWGHTNNVEWKGKLDLIRLRETIHSYAPHLPLISLSPSNDTTGYSLREAWRPSWLDPWMSRGNHSSDYEGPYDVWDWPCYCRPISNVITKHWTTITKKADIKLYLSAEDLFRYFIFQLACSNEGPAIMWGTSPYIDGGWETGIEEAFLKINSFIEPIKESIKGTLPSTSYNIKEGTILRDIPNGVAAVRSFDNTKEFLHILIPPTSNKLRLPSPADNKIFESAHLLNSDTIISLKQNEFGLEITLPEGYNWDKLCTTIELTVAKNSLKKRSLSFHKGVLYSTSMVSDNLLNFPYTHIRLVDGITTYLHKLVDWSTDIGGWRSKPNDLTPYVMVDLFKPLQVQQAVLFPSIAQEDCFDGVPIDFIIEASQDGVNFKEVYKKENLPTTSNPIVCDFEKILARYVKVTATKLRGDYFALAELEIF